MGNEQSAVALVLNVFGIALVTASAAYGVTQGFRNWRVFVSGVAGTALLLAGFFWPQIAPHLPRGLAESMGQVASNSWVWLVLLFAFWLYFAVLSLLLLQQRNQYRDVVKHYMNPFRLTLQRFVIPRHLTPEQTQIVGSHLSKFPPYTVVFKIYQHDNEANHYSRYLQKAVQAGGWTVGKLEYDPHPGWGLGFNFAYSEATGRRLQDHNETMPDQLLAEAFRLAEVQVDGTGHGMAGAGTPDQVSIHVGSRRLDLQAQPQAWPY